ncbi:transmembrane protein 70 homolog, mitochondrial [Diorhabda sublineata]|uniref:transmembrane protein 70 homolog, mitochondrial n=1 Tax=Diorhabda sublineata TaxID=1163346 RepID=UPI0024E1889F|nr:transmembrane protein 70 homolog, mitochondrial [Diorhabda sublineata]
MTLKAVLRILSPVKKCVNPSKNLFLSRSLNLRLNNVHLPPFSLHNSPQIRYVSTQNEKDVKQIYWGNLTPQIKAVKIFSLSSSLVGVISQPFLYKEIASTGNVPVIVAAYTAIGFFTVVTPILLHFITKKYVTHLNYKKDTDSYVAKTVNFFCVTKETEFTPEDVLVPDVPGMFTTIKVKGKPMFIDPRMFDYPEHYARIMGYDKPLDLKLYRTSENKK